MKTLAQTIQRANLYVERVTRLHDETGILVRSITGGGMQKQSNLKQKDFAANPGKKTQKKAEVKKMMMVMKMKMKMKMKKKKKMKLKNLKTGKELQMFITCDSMQPPGSTY